MLFQIYCFSNSQIYEEFSKKNLHSIYVCKNFTQISFFGVIKFMRKNILEATLLPRNQKLIGTTINNIFSQKNFHMHSATPLYNTLLQHSITKLHLFIS